MIIDGRLIDASFDDDVSHARTLEAFLREQPNGGLNNSVACLVSRVGHRASQLKRQFERMFIIRPPAEGNAERHYFVSNERLKFNHPYDT
jgi:hypothetical protein